MQRVKSPKKTAKVPTLTITALRPTSAKSDNTPFLTARSDLNSNRSSKGKSEQSSSSEHGASVDVQTMSPETGTSQRSSGAHLRRLSETAPAPYPLIDLLNTQHEDAIAVPKPVLMKDLIQTMASLSRAGKEFSQRKTNQDSCFAYKHFLNNNQSLCGVLGEI